MTSTVLVLPNLEVTVPTGRQSSSFKDDVALASHEVVTFEKTGAATVAALPKRHYNATGRDQKVRLVHVAANTAPTGAALTVDVKVSGTSVFAAAGDRAKVAASANAGEAVPNKEGDAIVLKRGQYLTAEITVVGSTVAGSDVVVQVHLA